MNKLFSKIAALSVGLAMAVGVGVAVNSGSSKVEEAKAAESAFYTLDGTITGGSSGYATESEITQNDVLWKVTGNTTMNPWRIGGKEITGVDRALYSNSSFDNTVSKVELSVLAASSITVNSLKLIVSKDGFTSNYDEVSESFSPNSTITFNPSSGKEWTGCAFKIVFNVTNTTKTNRFIQFSSLTLYQEINKQIESIDLVKESEAKTNYVDGDSVSFAGIKAIATFDDDSTSDVSSSCTITANKETVALGDSSITYSAEYNPGGFTIADLVVNISVEAVAVSSLSKSGNFRLDYVEKQKFSYGTGKVKAIYNNGTELNLDFSDAGVSTKIGTTDISGQTHYMTMDDNGKSLSISFGGVSLEIGTISVTEYIEPENGYWSPITDLSELEADMEVIFVAQGHEFAMGKYVSGNNITGIDISKDGEGKISSSIPGVQVYTVEKSEVVENTFAFNDGSAYIAATGGTTSNQLKTESTVTSKSSFAVTIEAGVMKIVSQGSTEDGARMTLRFNNNDLIFSCYGSSSSTGSLACLYKFTPESKSEDQIAVENFVKNSLKLDDSKEDYIDPNDNTPGTNCLGEAGLYNLAKIEYAKLTEAQKEIFGTSSDVLIMQGRARMVAWASANGEEFDPVAMTFSSLFNGYSLTNADNNNMMIIIAVISSVTVLSLGVLIALKKKKHN